MRLFCFGLGYTALALARQLAAEGWQIAGTTRDPKKQASLEQQGIEVWPFARGRPLEKPERALAGTTHVLSSIAPDEEGDPVLGQHARDLLRCTSIVWTGYLGTTGVYGDRGGDWVSEADPVAPSMPRTKRRARAEGHWLASGLSVHLFRLAGIYGPGHGRSALAAVRAGTARRIVKPGQVFCRIHVDDIVQVLRASMARPNPGAIYNVADDEPAPPQDVVAYACTLLGAGPPPEVPFDLAELSPMARSFYGDSRRVANARIKEELGVSLRYPSYREGLRALLDDPAHPAADEARSRR
ncbi:MAG TPA: SDR family oxidoreductase [Geminicoccaceae bacterium]|nr:SDR family oxidoreductase [Geminicoccaceae bacterium]